MGPLGDWLAEGVKYQGVSFLQVLHVVAFGGFDGSRFARALLFQQGSEKFAKKIENGNVSGPRIFFTVFDAALLGVRFAAARYVLFGPHNARQMGQQRSSHFRCGLSMKPIASASFAIALPATPCVFRWVGVPSPRFGWPHD